MPNKLCLYSRIRVAFHPTRSDVSLYVHCTSTQCAQSAESSSFLSSHRAPSPAPVPLAHPPSRIGIRSTRPDSRAAVAREKTYTRIYVNVNLCTMYSVPSGAVRVGTDGTSPNVAETISGKGSPHIEHRVGPRPAVKDRITSCSCSAAARLGRRPPPEAR